jgi:Holliday junction resolvase RusA-like endonuclease
MLTVGYKARQAMAAAKLERISGSVEVIGVFYVKRNKGHYGTGSNERVLKDSAPAYPGVRPDVDKYLRSANDAMTGVVWLDDGQEVDAHAFKRFVCRFEGVERTEVFVRPTPYQTVRDLVAAGLLEAPAPSVAGFEQLSLTVA